MWMAHSGCQRSGRGKLTLSPSFSPLQLDISVLLGCRWVRRGGLAGFWQQRAQRQKHKARSAGGAGMQQLCWRLSWFHTLSMLWSLGEDRGSQSLWVMDSLLRKMGMLQGLAAWDLLLLLQQNPDNSWIQKGKDQCLALFIPLFGGQDPGLIFEVHCLYPNIQNLIDGHF